MAHCTLRLGREGDGCCVWDLRSILQYEFQAQRQARVCASGERGRVHAPLVHSRGLVSLFFVLPSLSADRALCSAFLFALLLLLDIHHHSPRPSTSPPTSPFTSSSTSVFSFPFSLSFRPSSSPRLASNKVHFLSTHRRQVIVG